MGPSSAPPSDEEEDDHDDGSDEGDNSVAWLVAVGGAVDYEEPERKPLVKRPRWVPGFKEQVDLGVRAVTLAFEAPRTDEVSVAIEYRENGTSSSVWDAAIVLARFLELEARRGGPDAVAGKRVVELGAGTGFVGLVAAALGSQSVTLTDLECCLTLLRRNAGERATVEALSWGAPMAAAAASYDVVLVADCLLPGSTHLFAPLVATLAALLAHPASVALFAYEERMDCAAFFALADAAGLACARLTDLHPVYSAPEIHVLRIRTAQKTTTPALDDQ